jgi:hypothetical protein
LGEGIGVYKCGNNREHTIPLIAQYLCDMGGLKGMENELIFMQDNAPGHAAKRPFKYCMI